MQCNHCQTDLPPDAKVCPACGTPVPNSTNLHIDQRARDPTASGYPDDEAELARIFAAIYQQIEARPPEPDVDKDALVEAVRQIEQEAARGGDADPSEIKRWLQSLAVMAPDIVAATVSGLAGSASGIRAVIRQIAQESKAEADTR